MLVATPLSAQRARRCSLEVLNVDREGAQLTPFDGYVNYFGGGNVRLGCVGQNVRLGGDSLISLSGDVVFLFKNARYSDETIRLVADSLVYSRQSERIEARGAVTVTNIRTGSTITGPHLDYLRAVAGMRDSAEVQAHERPTVRYVPTRLSRDTATPEPYVIVADRLRGLGSSHLWGSGQVTIDRGSLLGTGDSMYYRTSGTNDLELIGIVGLAGVSDTARDSLQIDGKRVILELANDDLRRVRALGKATCAAAAPRSGPIRSRSPSTRERSRRSRRGIAPTERWCATAVTTSRVTQSGSIRRANDYGRSASSAMA